MCVITSTQEPVSSTAIEDEMEVFIPEPGRAERLQHEANLVKECVDNVRMPAKYRRHPTLEMYRVKLEYNMDEDDEGGEKLIPVILPDGWKLQSCEDHNYLQLCNDDNEVVFECFVRAFGGYPHWITC